MKSNLIYNFIYYHYTKIIDINWSDRYISPKESIVTHKPI